jgi:hypothetical protein
MEHIKDQFVNSFNAEIVPEFSTPEKRQEMAEELINKIFIVGGPIEYYGMKEFKAVGSEGPSLYWTFTFFIKLGPENKRLQTITLANYGGIDFSMHHFDIRSMKEILAPYNV